MGRVLKVDPKTGQIIDPPSYVQSSDTVFSGAGFNDYFSLDFFDVLGRDFFTGYNSATVWGTNFISFGKLNADQINYFVEKVASNGDIIFDEFPGAFVNVGYSKYSEVSDREDVIKLFKNDNASAYIQTSEFNFNFILDFKPYLDDEEVILSITQSEKSEVDSLLGRLSHTKTISLCSYKVYQ
jgi:predicted lactoylglutathione lyase